MHLKNLRYTLLAAAIASPALADDTVSYYRQIRPIFVANCNACHKPEKLKGDLDMTSVAMLLKGGKHGAAIVPGDPEKSRLVDMIGGDDPEMPKEGDSLTKKQIALVNTWVKQGANDDSPIVGKTKIEPPIYKAAPVVSSIAYSPDGSLLAVAGFHEVLLHKADGSEIVARLTGEAPRVESVCFSNDGKYLADCGGAPGEFGLFQVWKVEDRSLVKAQQVSGDCLYGISFAPDDKSVAFGGADKTVHRINLADGKEMLDFKAHADWVLGTAFTADGKQLVSAGRDKAMKLIDLENARFIDDINNPFEACLSLARNPKEAQILYGGDMGTARLYKISDNQGRTSGRIDTNSIRVFDKQPGAVTAVAISPDGKNAALGSINDVNVYQISDNKKVYTLSGEQGPVYSIAYRPDGSQIAVSGFDGMVRIYDAKTGTMVKAFSSVPVKQ